MFDHDTYIYAKLPYGLELPIEHVSHFDSVETTFEVPICVKGTPHYNQYEIVQSKNTIERYCGKGAKLITDRNRKKQRFTFAEAGTLSDRITDGDFMIHAIEAGQFEVGKEVFPLTSFKSDEEKNANIEDRKAHLAWLKTVKALFDKLGVTAELDCDNVSSADEAMLRKLAISVLHGELVEWTEPNEGFPDITIANLTIKLCVWKDNSSSHNCRIFGYSDAPIGYRMKNEEGQYSEVSYHVFLKKTSMLKCCNIDYTAIVRQLKTVPASEEYSSALVWLLLEMLCAYDESKNTRKDILDGAIELAGWLRNTDMHTQQDLLDLNYYQAVKRRRSLTAFEIQGLHSIIEGNLLCFLLAILADNPL